MTSTKQAVSAPSRADRLRNDERILAAAAELLIRDPGVSMGAIASAAGVARPTVYRRYPDRAALVIALRAAIDDELERALTAVPAWESGADVIGVLVRALVRVAARYPVALLRYAPVSADAPAADTQVSAILRAGQLAGHLRDDLPAETLHAALFGVLSAVLDGPARSDPEVAADTVLTLLPDIRRQSRIHAPEGHP